MGRSKQGSKQLKEISSEAKKERSHQTEKLGNK